VTPRDREEVAQQEVERAIAALPPELQRLAHAVPVLLLEHSDDPDQADLLGCFEGASLLDDCPPALPRILLFLKNLELEADGDPEGFIEEVRITFLHELGHYLGWDEDEIARQGLE